MCLSPNTPITNGRAPAPETADFPWLSFLDLPLVNMQQALAYVDHDEALLRDVAACFFQTCPQQLVALQQALEETDAAAVAAAAHWLKGGLGSVGSQPAYRLAELIEYLAADADLCGVGLLISLLQVEIQRLEAFFDAHHWRQENGI